MAVNVPGSQTNLSLIFPGEPKLSFCFRREETKKDGSTLGDFLCVSSQSM